MTDEQGREMGTEVFTVPSIAQSTKTDKKLTPRVGDRVLLGTTAFTADGKRRTYLGVVTHTNALDARVFVAEVDEGGWWPLTCLTVVDREPVEWPEGWRRHEWVGKVGPASFRIGSTYVGKDVFERIRGPEGDYVAEHMDELMGGDA